MTDDAIQRLARLGYTSNSDLKLWRHHWDDMGEKIFLMMLERRETGAIEYEHWYPRLKQYAAECRWNEPIPFINEQSKLQREQHRIMLKKMKNNARSKDCIVRPKPLGHNVTILSTSYNGLNAAEQIFGKSHVVILLESERDHWYNDVYPDGDDPYSWCNHVWFTLDEKFDESELENAHRYHPIAEGCSYWIVEAGLAWGSLAGGAKSELWCWDGTTATYLGEWADITF